MRSMKDELIPFLRAGDIKRCNGEDGKDSSFSGKADTGKISSFTDQVILFCFAILKGRNAIVTVSRYLQTATRSSVPLSPASL